MKILLKDILGFKISARNGNIGIVHDFLFNDSDWKIHYIVVNTGTIIFDNLVLLLPEFIVALKPSQKHILVNLEKSDIIQSPNAESKKPISQQYMDSYVNNYNMTFYWYGFDTLGLPPMINHLKQESEKEENKTKDPELAHLRSVREVLGYHIINDDEPGKIKNIVADDYNWAILSLYINTGAFLHHHYEELDIGDVLNISFEERAVYVKTHSFA